jgi:hypothetical protein
MDRARVSIAGPRAILPQAPKRADTATTITLPQSYITPIGSIEGELAVIPQSVTYEEATTTTTLVSHSTITSKTEISWTTGNRITSSHHVEPDHPAATLAYSECRSQPLQHQDTSPGPGCEEQNIRASVGSVTFQAEDSPTSRRSSRTLSASRAYIEGYPPGNASIVSSESSITSCPALRKRHCTNDWLTPPAATPGAKDSNKANLYNVGIDAHAGPGGFFSSSAVERPLVTPAVTADDSIFVEPGFGAARDAGFDGSTHKLGTSIGISTSRRRSHHVLLPESALASSSVLQKLRRGSAPPGHALGSVGVGQAQQPQQTEQGRRASSVDRMRVILERTSAHHGRRDTMGHRKAKMVSRSAASRPPDTGSEDGRPHLCADHRHSSYGSHSTFFGSGT